MEETVLPEFRLTTSSMASPWLNEQMSRFYAELVLEQNGCSSGEISEILSESSLAGVMAE